MRGPFLLSTCCAATGEEAHAGAGWPALHFWLPDRCTSKRKIYLVGGCSPAAYIWGSCLQGPWDTPLGRKNEDPEAAHVCTEVFVDININIYRCLCTNVRGGGNLKLYSASRCFRSKRAGQQFTLSISEKLRKCLLCERVRCSVCCVSRTRWWGFDAGATSEGLNKSSGFGGSWWMSHMNFNSSRDPVWVGLYCLGSSIMGVRRASSSYCCKRYWVHDAWAGRQWLYRTKTIFFGEPGSRRFDFSWCVSVRKRSHQPCLDLELYGLKQSAKH